MTYIDLINDFWQEFEDRAMKPNDALLYLYLLKVCNSKGWENPFELSNKRVRLCLEITDKAIVESRNRLVERGLIEVSKGERNRTAPTYTLLRFYFPTESKKGGKREVKEKAKKEVKAQQNGSKKGGKREANTQQNGSKKGGKREANTQQNGSKKGNIIIDKEKDKEIEYFVVVGYAREKFLQDFFSEEKRRSLEELCMGMHTDLATMKRLAEAVLNEWEATDEPTHPDMNRAKQHLVSQIRIKLKSERDEAMQRERRQGAKPAAANKQQDKAPRRVNDQWDGFELPTE